MKFFKLSQISIGHIQLKRVSVAFWRSQPQDDSATLAGPCNKGKLNNYHKLSISGPPLLDFKSRKFDSGHSFGLLHKIPWSSFDVVQNCPHIVHQSDDSILNSAPLASYLGFSFLLVPLHKVSCRKYEYWIITKPGIHIFQSLTEELLC